MKILLDQNLQRSLLPPLRAAGFDVVHTWDAELAQSSDEEVFDWCCATGRMLVTSDKKLTKYLAASGMTCPTVVILRDTRLLAVEDVATLLVANLPGIKKAVIEYGNAVFTLAPSKPIRGTLLPLGTQ